MKKEIECEHTYEVVCPFCGHEQSDSWEISEGTNQCRSCDKKFSVEVHQTVTYSTKKIECLNDKSKHNWELVRGYETKTYPGRDHLVYRYCRKCRDYKWLDKSEVSS